MKALFLLLLSTTLVFGEDPFVPYLDGKPPEILSELPNTEPVPENITLRRVMFRSRNNSEIFAVIATPKAEGKHPGLLVLHGGSGSAEVDKAIAWAQRGYVAVAPDLPGIADPKKLTGTKGEWSALPYGSGRWTATPETSVIFDAVLAAMKSLELLRAQPQVDPSRIGVVGISWGGYMTTMVCALAGDKVRAGFSVFGCGFYELTSQGDGPKSNLGKMPDDQRALWLEHLDPGRRLKGLKASFFIVGATNDFFFWPRAVQATLDGIPGEKNQLFVPNANHKVPLPGGMEFPTEPPFQPTAFQPYPTPTGSKANWLAMEVPFFDYYLKGKDEPFPVIHVERDSAQPRFTVTSQRPMKNVEIFWAKTNPDVKTREWISLAPKSLGKDQYEAGLPPEAADWFVVATDDRPVTVSSALISTGRP